MPVTCAYCQGVTNYATIREHNLRCAEYGERVYLGRDDPRVPLSHRIRRVASPAVRKASEDDATRIDSGDDHNTSASRTEG